MKKKIVSIMLCCMMAVAVLNGCGSNDATAANQTENAEAGQTAGGQTIAELQGTRTYNVMDYVKLCDYSNITIDVAAPTVTDEEIDQYIDLMCNYNKAYQVVDKLEAEDGDYVNIDYVGKKDGVAFNGGTADGYVLGLGTGTFIPGFEEGIVGHQVGETFDLDLTFPENYGNEELKGQAVVFTVTLNSIVMDEEIDHTNITDEYVKEYLNSNDDVTDVATLKEFIRVNVLSDKAADQDSSNREQLAQYLMDNCEVNIPDGLADDKTNEYMAQMTVQLEDAGHTLDEYLEQSAGMSYEEYFDTIKERITENLTLELILEAIACESGLTVDEVKFQSYMSNALASSSYDSVEKLNEMYTTEYCDGETYMRRGFLISNAYDNVINSTKFNVVEAE